MYAIAWFLIFLILVAVEIITLGLTTIWFAGGALAAFILAAAGVKSIFIQIIVFLAVSVMLLIFTRPLAKKYINKHTVRTNVDDMIGRTGKVTEEINNIEATGAVSINGNEWTARSAKDSIIPAGAVVRVVRIEGVKAIVEMEKLSS